MKLGGWRLTGFVKNKGKAKAILANAYWDSLNGVFWKPPEPEGRAALSCWNLFAFLSSPIPSKHPGSPGTGTPQGWGKPITREGTH